MEDCICNSIWTCPIHWTPKPYFERTQVVWSKLLDKRLNELYPTPELSEEEVFFSAALQAPQAESFCRSPSLAGLVRCLTITKVVGAKETAADMWKLVDRIVNYRQFCVIDYYAAVELTKAGEPHIHLLLIMDKANKRGIDKALLKKWWPHMIDCQPPKDRTGDNYLNYLKKELDNNIVQKYCKENNIKQYDSKISESKT